MFCRGAWCDGEAADDAHHDANLASSPRGGIIALSDSQAVEDGANTTFHRKMLVTQDLRLVGTSRHTLCFSSGTP